MNWRFYFLLMLMLALGSACGSVDEFENDDAPGLENIETNEETISLDQATAIAVNAGVNNANLIYAELLPLTLSDGEVMLTWGFIEKFGTDDFHVTYVDRWTGEILEVGVKATENIHDFLDRNTTEMRNNMLMPLAGTSQNSYDSFPWGWQLPMWKASNPTYLTRGYNVATHTGLDYYATDWDPGDLGFDLATAASCWVIYRTYSSSYGYQFIGECGDAGGGKRYFFRAAHMDQVSPLLEGWWVNKDTYMGEMGNRGTGNGGYHVHFAVYKAKSFIKGTFTSGESVSINTWPSNKDSICDKKFAGYNFFGEKGSSMPFNIKDTGCL